MPATKLTHDKASYRNDGTPTRHCSICLMYRDRPTNRCTLVEDPIDPYAVCKYFEARK